MAKVLVVDDNDLVRASTRAILESAGHEAREVADASAAIEAVKSGTPDLVLTDLVMPGTPGGDLIRTLRSAGYDGAIIAMSGGGGASGPANLLERARELGANDCMSKPFHRADLLAKVALVLRRRRDGDG
jgi:DNA-binding response OmpR family regulator